MSNARPQTSRAFDGSETLDLSGQRTQTSSLPISAEAAYELFCQVEFTVVWASTAHTPDVRCRDEAGLPTEVSFAVVLNGIPGRFVLHYQYDPRRRTVSWATESHSPLEVRGHAYFLELGPEACLMHYELSIQPPEGTKSPFRDNPAARVVSEFRELALKSKPG